MKNLENAENRTRGCWLRSIPHGQLNFLLQISLEFKIASGLNLEQRHKTTISCKFGTVNNSIPFPPARPSNNQNRPKLWQVGRRKGCLYGRPKNWTPPCSSWAVLPEHLFWQRNKSLSFSWDVSELHVKLECCGGVHFSSRETFLLKSCWSQNSKFLFKEKCRSLIILALEYTLNWKGYFKISPSKWW